MLTQNGITRIAEHTQATDNLQKYGGSVSPEYERVRARINEYHAIESEKPLQQLIEVTLAPDSGSDEIRSAYADALTSATATAVHKATVRNAVMDEFAAALARAYKSTAESNYTAIATRFNKAAKAFTKAHNTVPATTDAAKLVTADAATRKAWTEAQALAPELDQLTSVLAVAAKLAGKGDYSNKSGLIGVSISADGCHRRRIWEAWDQPVKWAALIDEGATITAPELDNLARYREPRPVEERWVPSEWGHRRVLHDPEDGDTNTVTATDLEQELDSSEAWTN